MGTAVKKTIPLPPDLAREAEETARAASKWLRAVVQETLPDAGKWRLSKELRALTIWALPIARGHRALCRADTPYPAPAAASRA